MACFPVGFPLNLHVSVGSRHELQGIVLRSGSSVGLDCKPVLSWREIRKKDRALRQFADRRTIRVNDWGSRIDIASRRIRLTEKPYSCHVRSNCRKLYLRGGRCRLRGTAPKRQDAQAEPYRSKGPISDHNHILPSSLRPRGRGFEVGSLQRRAVQTDRPDSLKIVGPLARNRKV